jgi:hypothetical protein
MTSEDTRVSNEAAIRKLIDRLVKAVRAKDITEPRLLMPRSSWRSTSFGLLLAPPAETARV